MNLEKNLSDNDSETKKRNKLTKSEKYENER